MIVQVIELTTDKVGQLIEKFILRYSLLGLLFCILDINECATTPCMNNATCNNLNNTYSCNCVEGFIGTTCENK